MYLGILIAGSFALLYYIIVYKTNISARIINAYRKRVTDVQHASADQHVVKFAFCCIITIFYYLHIMLFIMNLLIYNILFKRFVFIFSGYIEN